MKAKSAPADIQLALRWLRAYADAFDRYRRDQTKSKAQYLQGSEELRRRLPSADTPWWAGTGPKTDMNEHRRFLHLPPVEKGTPTFLPVVALSWDYAREGAPDIRVRVLMFHCTPEPAGLTNHYFGWRFEPPEGSGRHSYYHCQPITDFTKNDPHASASGDLGPPVNTSQPTFPLPASNAAELTACALLSLYGLDDLGRKLNTDSFGREILKAWAQKLQTPAPQTGNWESERVACALSRQPSS